MRLFSSPGVYAWVRAVQRYESPINGAFETNSSFIPRRQRLGYEKITNDSTDLKQNTQIANMNLRNLRISLQRRPSLLSDPGLSRIESGESTVLGQVLHFNTNRGAIHFETFSTTANRFDCN